MTSTLNRILSRPSPFGNETGTLPMGEFEPSPELLSNLKENTHVLVVGAGGLGCELLKDLALSGFKKIDVIDMDTIDISNLNRQFLFRHKDVGRSKAETAAEFIMTRIPDCKVNYHVCKIQDKEEEFYKQFNLIISGLDNIDARRWLNSLLVNMVYVETEGEDAGEIDPDTIIPLVDGGTEGFKGQARVIVPRITSCFECSLGAFPPQTAFPLCTIADTPRIPEHCIAYAYLIEWDKERKDIKLDKDSPEHMQWIFEKAASRAAYYGIEGVTYFKTMGVVKNIIPAVASTNAVIAAACTLEALKLITYCGQTLHENMRFAGVDGVYTHTHVYERLNDCPVCSNTSVTRNKQLPSTTTLTVFMESLSEPPFRMKQPSMTSSGSSGEKTIYMQNPESLRKALAPNLDKELGELIEDGDTLYITGQPLVGALPIKINLI